MKLILEHYHPNLIDQKSITFYSLPLNLSQQIITNFSTFHLFIISISVLQYYIRYYRLIKNTYSSYFFNGQNLLLTNHTNVALLLSGSLALIFSYNFIFYNPQYPHTRSLLPVITFNMILLCLVNVLIFSFVLVCFIIRTRFHFHFEHLTTDNEQENLRSIIEKNTCIKCYSEILQKNPNLFQDKNYSYRNFFSKHLRLSFERKYFSDDLENPCENDLFLQTTLMNLNHQHSLCHLCYYLLLIFLMKYILLTFPHYVLQMSYYLKQFYYLIFTSNIPSELIYSSFEKQEFLSTTSHLFFLLSRFGDSFLLIRLTYLIKKYFPCWCHFNSQFLRKEQISHQILTTKNSESSNNEPISNIDINNSNEIEQQETIERSHLPSNHHHRYRLKFQFIPLWSRNRPRLFQERL